MREASRQDSHTHSSEAEVASLYPAVRQIVGDHAPGVSKGKLGKGERHPVLLLVLRVLGGIPFGSRDRRECPTGALYCPGIVVP
jgi:hypothetical protein